MRTLHFLALAVSRYSRYVGLAGDATVGTITWIPWAAGGLPYIASSPFFY